VDPVNSTALHWCNRPHRANSLTLKYRQKAMATGKCQKKDYDNRNEDEKKPQKRKRATKGR